jgi:predicted nucleic acid-binding protein
VIFVDSNIPMYLVGSDNPHKHRVQRLLERVSHERRPLVTDVEVFQEILHRFISIRRPEAIDPTVAVLQAIVDEVYPIEFVDFQRARRLIRTSGSLSARDALHIAVMQRRDVEAVMTFDRGFEGIPGIERITE